IVRTDTCMAKEFCEVDYQLWTNTPLSLDPEGYYWGRDPQFEAHSRRAHATMRLFTGGKKMSHRQNLWTLSATATEITNILAIPPFQQGDWASTNIPAGQIAIGTNPPTSDGLLHVVLPDCTYMEITPTAAGYPYYMFDGGATKHILNITANDV